MSATVSVNTVMAEASIQEEVKEHPVRTLIEEGEICTSKIIDITYTDRHRHSDVQIMGEFNQWMPEQMFVDLVKSKQGAYVFIYRI